MTDSPEKALEFVLRLACAENFSDNQAIEALVNHLTTIEDKQYFPILFNTIDPDQFYSETKVLPEFAKERLRQATERYVKARQSR